MFTSFNTFQSKTNNHNEIKIKIKLKYIIKTSGLYTILLINENCTLNFSEQSNITYFLICSGGGGGGYNVFGGNGGGENLGTITPVLGTNYPIASVDGPGGGYTRVDGIRGGTSSAFNVSVTGGAGGKYLDAIADQVVTGGTGINNNGNVSDPARLNKSIPAGMTYSNGPLVSSATGENGLYVFGGCGGRGGNSGKPYGGGDGSGSDGLVNSGGGGAGFGFDRGGVKAGSGGSGIVVVSFLTSGNSYTIV